MLGISMQIALLLAACMGAANAARGAMELDLIFPRNETYAPTEIFPVIIAIQNTELAPFLNPQMTIEFLDLDSQVHSYPTFYDLRWANYSSSDPYRELKVFTSFNKEGRWRIAWQVRWNTCTEDSLAFLGDGITGNGTSRITMFTINNSGKVVDPVPATTNQNCTNSEAIVINVDDTLAVPDFITWEDYDGKTCASMASTTPAPTPCQVKFDSAAAADIFSSMTSLHCKQTREPGSSCPTDDKSAAEQLVGVGLVGLAATFGALGYLIV
ncbi:uncharacterized protein J4E84_006263 [Alternaria hordeiaustralica]|uniref:uncharacterized protein n=1 Tax=Alternaria hordeiaustralica TaxID=1187925 RepID=UPI0020C33036|nr:uncharacterized protein J4E84_006263 [Alternaria hordeiaustralica]KAI4685535.1 hypothetical protein J4E84_006263 [Alternaria hordeiaustralica]